MFILFRMDNKTAIETRERHIRILDNEVIYRKSEKWFYAGLFYEHSLKLRILKRWFRNSQIILKIEN